MHVVAGRVTRGSCHWRRRLGGGGADGDGQEGGKGECAGGKAPRGRRDWPHWDGGAAGLRPLWRP